VTMRARARASDSGGDVIAGQSIETVSIPTPRWRGRLHQVALIIAIPATIRLVVAAPSGPARVATAFYSFSLVGLFAASSAYHGLNWSQPALGRMRSLDHSMIFVLIAGTYTAFGVLALRVLWRLLVLAVVWTGALAGITIKLVKSDRLSSVADALYIALGWTGIAALPQVLSDRGALPVALIVAGGLMYTVGALVLLRRRPDPNPDVFGYHEVWHALVVAASTCHYAAITVLVRTGG
jgi:hemolysin III